MINYNKFQFNFLFCLFIIQLFKSIATYPIIKAGINYERSKFSLNTSMKQNNNSYLIPINLQSNISFYITLVDELKTENFVRNEEVKIDSQSYIGYLNYDNITIEDVSIPLYYYGLSREIRVPYSLLGFTFALSPLNESFSIVHQLYNSKKINKKIFTFIPYDSHRGEIVIGDIPFYATKNKYESECKVKRERWGCELNSIYFEYEGQDNKLFQMNKTYTFLLQTTVSEIFAPEEFITFLKDTLFKKYLENGQCEFETNSNNNHKTFLCNYSYRFFESFPSSIHFVIGDYDFTIPKSKLFSVDSFAYYRDEDEVKYFIFNIYSMKNSTGYGSDVWIFGKMFLLEFTTTFDYDNKKIFFYQKKLINKIQNGNLYDKIILSLIIIVLIMGIFLLLYNINKITIELKN